MLETRRRLRPKGQVFRALQGHKIVAGGSAPGMLEARSPTLKGSHYPELWDARAVSQGFDPFRVGPCGAGFPGALPPATLLIPSRDRGRTVPRVFWGRRKHGKGVLIRGTAQPLWDVTLGYLEGDVAPRAFYLPNSPAFDRFILTFFGLESLGRVIAIANQKGGVGKTTTAINLGAALASRDMWTLIIDCDPQANTTGRLGLPQRSFAPDDIPRAYARCAP